MLTTRSQRRAWRDRILSLAEDDEAGFDAAACQLFGWQYEANPVLRRLADAKSLPPSAVRRWRDIPAVPQRLFKETDVCCGNPGDAKIDFHTSGTTTGSPGRQRLRDTTVYHGACVTGARRAGLLDHEREMHFLAPASREAPHSSLSAMFEAWCDAAEASRPVFWVRRNQLRLDGLRERLEARMDNHTPVLLAGTAFAFVHYIDMYSSLDPIPLPRGSWIMETGGFKGRSREMEKEEFYGALAYLFEISPDRIWNEYGMTELSSQAYAQGPQGMHRTPPWARVRIVNPETGAEVGIGETGIVEWLDLANVDTALAVQTLDLAARAAGGFYLLGRIPQADPRGCSLTAETFRTRRPPSA